MKKNNYVASILSFFVTAFIGIPAVTSLYASQHYMEYTLGLFVLVCFLVWAISLGLEGTK